MRSRRSASHTAGAECHRLPGSIARDSFAGPTGGSASRCRTTRTRSGARVARWSARGWPQETYSCSQVTGTWVSISGKDAWCMRHPPEEPSRSWSSQARTTVLVSSVRGASLPHNDDHARVASPRARPAEIPYRHPPTRRGPPSPMIPLSTAVPESSEEREDDEHDDQDQEPSWHVFTSWRN